MSSGVMNHALSEEQIRTIRQELQRILESDAFTGSKRCQEFLHFVIDRAVSADAERLKERAIGAELFGRAIGYETSTDPIVRVKANDVRRRLTRYNLETAGHNPLVTILLPPGSYVPEFHWAQGVEGNPVVTNDAPSAVTGIQQLVEVPSLKEQPLTSSIWERIKGHRLLTAILLTIPVLAAVLWMTHSRASELDRFWRSAIIGDTPVMVCFGRTYSVWLSDNVQRQIEEHPNSVSIGPEEFYRVYDNMASAGNLRAALSVIGLLQQKRKPAEVLWASEARANDLRDRNLVLLGAFNNPWTIDFNKDLRFIFEHQTKDNKLLWVIRDQKTPGRKWTLDATYPQPITRDYAIITRLFDRNRGRVVVSAGGMNQFGTEVAGEYLCDPAFWRELARSAPRDWDQKNLQVVLETEIAGNKPVRPRVIDSYFW